MRTLKELYTIVLNNFDKCCEIGICNLVYKLESNGTITFEEHDKLYKHFSTKKIRFWSKFYWNESFRGQIGWWWKLNEEGNKQRKLYLQHIINSL